MFLRDGIVNKRFLLNEEYPGFVTLVDPDNNADVGRTMLAAGYVLVENRRERFLKPLIKDYLESQDIARTNRVCTGVCRASRSLRNGVGVCAYGMHHRLRV